MRAIKIFFVSVLASAALLCGAALPAQSFTPQRRIVDRIDESRLVALKGNTHPAANAQNDRGRVSPDLRMSDLILVLSRDPAQQAAFEKFVAGEYDSNSPNFHQWLTPEQVGENFGPSPADIATVSTWLTGHGFSVDEIPANRLSIRFSGTAAQVESAFHTEIHNLEVKGVAHIANMSDPQIPASMATTVVGVKALHNFFPHPLHHMGNAVTRDTASGKWKRPAASASTETASLVASQPDFGISVGGTSPYLVEDVSPFDFATIYNILPLWNASAPIDGTGQTIAIAGTSAIVPNDVATFRSFFGLPPLDTTGVTTPSFTNISGKGQGQPIVVCTGSTSNSLCSLNDLIENSLDVEWSGSVAKGASIVLVSSYPASASDDALYDSESYIVNNLTARIMNVSYGECELGNGTAGNVQYYNLWQAAAAEGISVFVATGDSGAASCDQGGDSAYGVPYPAEYGLTVSGLASTPYNTAVGGTDFNWCPLLTTATGECTASPYWSSTNSSAATGSSTALGYIPEVPWNDTCTSPLILSYMEAYASSGPYKVTGITNAEEACNFVVDYNYPGYYNGLEGLYYTFPGLLDTVDTVGGSGGASGCVVNSTDPSTGTLGSCTATTGPGTTGAANGSIPTYNNGWPKPVWQQQATNNIPGLPTDGVRDIPDVSFFASSGFLSSSAYLICVSNVAACSYDSKSEPTAQEVGGTSVATPAMAGVMALINQKTGEAQGNPNAELYKLAAQQNYSGCSAERGNGAPVTNSTCLFNDIDQGTNAMACDYDAYTNTPSPNCALPAYSVGGFAGGPDLVGILPGYNAVQGYDQATGLGSLNVANVVKAWPATASTATATVTVSPAEARIFPNNTLRVAVTAAGAIATPTNVNVPPTGMVTLTASGSSYSASGVLSATGTYTFTIPANMLAAATTPTITVSYAGDAVYKAASGNATVQIKAGTAPTPTLVIAPASNTVNSDASLSVTVTVNEGSSTPQGAVTLASGSYSSIASTPAGGIYSFTIPANSLTGTVTGQSDPLTATYSGDGSYGYATGTQNVTVMESTFSLAAPPIASLAPGAITGNTTTVTVTALNGYAGTATLTCQLLNTTASGGDGASCYIPSTSVPIGGTTTATITTHAPYTVALLRPESPRKGKGWTGAGGGALLALLLFFGVPARRRNWRSMLGILTLLVALGSLAACSSSSSTTPSQSDPGTTAGTYTFTVQATGNPSVTPAVSTTFTVTVN